jgi:hypothetical protein
MQDVRQSTRSTTLASSTSKITLHLQSRLGYDLLACFTFT